MASTDNNNNNTNSTSLYPRSALLQPAQALCAAISRGATPTELLTYFTHDPFPAVHEHGLPALAPFLGRTFTGGDGVERYFSLVGQLLRFDNLDFDPEDQWVVDGVAMAVVVRGHARLVWRETDEAWHETFCYRMAVAEDMLGSGGGGGGEAGRRGLKVQEYRVWADTGAAYLARVGGLGEVVGREGAGEDGMRFGEGRGTGVTRKEAARRRSGCGEVLGSGLQVYGSCG